MKLRRTLVSAAAGAALVATALTGATAAQATPGPPSSAPSAAAVGTTPLAAVLAPYATTWNRSWNDYNIVTHAVFAVLEADPTSPVGVLADGNVALTAFIPNDRAFQVLVRQISGKTLTTESEVFAAVAGLGIPAVEQVLLYHVVPGATVTAAMARASDGADLTTALGETIHVGAHAGPQILLEDKDANLRNPRVILSQVDINKGNLQIAHGIDRVLLPFSV
jgi:hypothetical protein